MGAQGAYPPKNTGFRPGQRVGLDHQAAQEAALRTAAEPAGPGGAAAAAGAEVSYELAFCAQVGPLPFVRRAWSFLPHSPGKYWLFPSKLKTCKPANLKT